MPMEISEMRPDDFEEVVSLFQDIVAAEHADNQGDDSSIDTDQPLDPVLDHTASYQESILSLVVRDEGKLIAAILCNHDQEQGYTHRLAVAGSHRQSPIVKTLVDKALRKLNSNGINTYRLFQAVGIEQQPFWEAVRWVDCPDLSKTQTPVPSTAVTDRTAAQQDRQEEISDEQTDTPRAEQSPVPPQESQEDPIADTPPPAPQLVAQPGDNDEPSPDHDQIST